MILLGMNFVSYDIGHYEEFIKCMTFYIYFRFNLKTKKFNFTFHMIILIS